MAFGSSNYTCQMCAQPHPGRGKGFTRKMSLNTFKKNMKLNKSKIFKNKLAKSFEIYNKAAESRYMKYFFGDKIK